MGTEIKSRSYEELYAEWKLQAPLSAAEYEKSLECIHIVDKALERYCKEMTEIQTNMRYQS